MNAASATVMAMSQGLTRGFQAAWRARSTGAGRAAAPDPLRPLEAVEPVDRAGMAVPAEDNQDSPLTFRKRVGYKGRGNSAANRKYFYLDSHKAELGAGIRSVD